MGRERDKRLEKVLFRWKLMYRSVGKRYTLRVWEDNVTIERFEFRVSTNGGFSSRSKQILHFPEDGDAFIRVSKGKQALPSSAVFVRLRRQADLPDDLNLYTNNGKGLHILYTIKSGINSPWERV